MTALSTAATGMLAQQLNVEVISNNIANMNTTAFKRQRANFQDLLYQNMEQVGTTSSDSGTIDAAGVQIGTGVRTDAVYRITEQGNLVSTDNTFDIAIQGQGYFGVTLPSGDTAYTRAGTFQISATGEIVTSEGYPITPGLSVPADAVDVTINATGEVLAKIDGQIDPQNVGQIDLTIFPNSAGLEAAGGNLFLETPSSGTANTGVPGQAGFGTLLQGFLENANVNAVSEITDLIAAQRAYEMNSKVISTADEMLSVTSNL